MININNSAFNFHTLTPSVIFDAIESTGIRVDSGLTELNSFENRVFQFMDEERHRYVVKFYRPGRWTEEQIWEEHQFISELAVDEIPVVSPLTLQKKTLHHFAGYSLVLFPSMGGRQYEVDNEDQLDGVGRYLGRIHQVGKRCCFQQRPTIELKEYLYQPRAVLDETVLIPVALKKNFLMVLDTLIAEIEARWHTDWLPLRLHGDCHPGNILWRDGPLFVDLDDARNGPAIQDLWMLLHGERNNRLVQLDILLEAYSEFATFDQQQLHLIEPLCAMRMVHYLAWVVRRWQDPAFPKNFPWMTDESFWLKQIAIFREQVKLLQAPPLQLMPVY